MKADSSAQCLLFKNIIVVKITCVIYGMLTGVNSYWTHAFDDCVNSCWALAFDDCVGRWHFRLQDCTILDSTTSNFKSLFKLLENQQYMTAHGNSEKCVIIVILALSLVIHVVYSFLLIKKE
ncbi:hypothetical protein AMTRI_Chr13g86680 [Amborella trichopoda]